MSIDHWRSMEMIKQETQAADAAPGNKESKGKPPSPSLQWPTPRRVSYGRGLQTS